MKTKQQKAEELKEGEALLNKSEAVLFFDFSKVKTSDLRNLRRELKASGNPLFIIKRRLLALLLKKQNEELEALPKASIATVFVSNIESAAASVYKFFSALEKEKKVEAGKILGGYDAKAKIMIPKERVMMIGQLPPREILLAQLLGMIAAPIRSFLYVLSEKSKQAVVPS